MRVANTGHCMCTLIPLWAPHHDIHAIADGTRDGTARRVHWRFLGGKQRPSLQRRSQCAAQVCD